MDFRFIRWALLMLSLGFVSIAITNIEERFTYLFIGVAFLVLYIMGLICRCPKCKSWWAASETSSKDLRNWTEFRTEKKVKEVKNEKYEIIGTVETDGIKPISCVERMHYYKCRYCGSIWSKKKVHRY